MPEIRRTHCKSLLNRTSLPADYSVNPYLGCVHGCVYCYARYMLKFASGPGDWGEFVEVKENAEQVLLKELRRRRPGKVYFSSVTDAYQPAEEKTMLTRTLIGILCGLRFPVIIQTKSDLVLRDMDIIRRAPDIEVGFSLATLDDGAGAVFEPGAPPPSKRIKALEMLHREGIKTFCMIAPCLPGITEPGRIRERLGGTVGRFLEDRLNYKCGNRPYIHKAVAKNYPELAPGYVVRRRDIASQGDIGRILPGARPGKLDSRW